MEYDVVIVGAGAAGMFAARELARGGRSVALVEARERVGGRLYEVAGPRIPAPIELGGEFVHGRPAITYGLLHEFGATVVDTAQSGFAFHDGALRAAHDDPEKDAGKLLARALDRAEDESVDALIAREGVSGMLPASGRFARRLVAGFDAADPARASARAIAQEWAGDASAGGAQSRPIAGYAPLIAHLASSLDPAHVDLRLRTLVTRIARDASGLRVTACALDREVVFRARRAVVCVPHGVLAAEPGALGAIAFEPPLPGQRCARSRASQRGRSSKSS